MVLLVTLARGRGARRHGQRGRARGVGGIGVATAAGRHPVAKPASRRAPPRGGRASGAPEQGAPARRSSKPRSRIEADLSRRAEPSAARRPGSRSDPFGLAGRTSCRSGDCPRPTEARRRSVPAAAARPPPRAVRLVSRSTYWTPGSASMITSRPVDGVRMRYFWRILIPRHATSGLGRAEPPSCDPQPVRPYAVRSDRVPPASYGETLWQRIPRNFGALAAAGPFCWSLSGCAVKHPTANLVNGKKLFVAKCGSCHTLAHAGTNGVVGPNLDDAFRQDRADQLRSSDIRGPRRLLDPVPERGRRDARQAVQGTAGRRRGWLRRPGGGEARAGHGGPGLGGADHDPEARGDQGRGGRDRRRSHRSAQVPRLQRHRTGRQRDAEDEERLLGAPRHRHQGRRTQPQRWRRSSPAGERPPSPPPSSPAPTSSTAPSTATRRRA